jgi:hypothetical protein
MASFLTAPFADNVRCLPTNVKRFLAATGLRTPTAQAAAEIATSQSGKSAIHSSFGRGWPGGELCHDGVAGALACVLEGVPSEPASADGGARHDQAAVTADAAGSAVIIACATRQIGIQWADLAAS